MFPQAIENKNKALIRQLGDECLKYFPATIYI
jgi:hypothetical protein